LIAPALIRARINLAAAIKSECWLGASLKIEFALACIRPAKASISSRDKDVAVGFDSAM
jgi:hypothetical protein